MTPTALSIISVTFTEGSERNKALGIWSALGGVGAATAWLIGGPLVEGPGRSVDLLHQHRRRPRRARAVARTAGRQLGRAAPAKLRPAGALTITGALVLLVVRDGARGVDLTRSAGEEVS